MRATVRDVQLPHHCGSAGLRELRLGNSDRPVSRSLSLCRLHALVLLVTAALSLWASSSVAAPPSVPPSAPLSAPPNIQPTLIVETRSPAPGQTVTVAILMQPRTGWHGYWLNPGDAGLGMDAQWRVPQGASVGALRYPVPSRLVIAGLMNHVYEGSYALLADLRVPADARPGDPMPVMLDAKWLACTDQVCVPEEARLAIELVVGDGTIADADRRRFDGWRAAMPRPLDVSGTYALTSGTLRIAIPYPGSASVSEPWFYAATRDKIAYPGPQSVTRAGDRLIIEAPAAANATAQGAVEGVLDVGSGTAIALTLRPGAVPPAGRALDARSGEALPFLAILGGALLGGLLLNIMPCVFPILSLKAIGLVRAGAGASEARTEAVAYTAGTTLACLALGAVMLALRAAGESVGWAFQLQDSRVIALLLVLMVAITLNLAGLYALPMLDGGRQAKGGARGALLTGALAAFVATPCTGPFMAAAIGAALLLPWPLALGVFAGLGLGLALPFLLIAFIPALRARLPKPGAWMERMRRILAVPMALTALALGWLLWRQGGSAGVWLAVGLTLATGMLLVLVGRLQRRGRGVALASLLGTAAVAAGAILLTPLALGGSRAAMQGSAPVGERFDMAGLDRLRREGTPVFLYFTADWCVTCKVNEANAIDRDAVRDSFRKAGVRVMVGDWTTGNADITRFLESQGRSGVPLYLFYPKNGGEPRVLPQILTPALLAALPEG